jgi:hypothetical protein
MVFYVGRSSLESSIKLPCPVFMSHRSCIQTEEHAMSMTAPAHTKLVWTLSFRYVVCIM